MQQLAESDIIAAIESGEPFSAVLDSGAFSITVTTYAPVVATAIHDGHTTLEPFSSKFAVSESERYFEEDPYTGQLTVNAPISITALDSRFMYDLNRGPETCIYSEAWGKNVWQHPLTPEQREELLLRHESYYRILDALLEKLTKEFKHCLVYDFHSYNYKRHNGSPPLFNIGTHFMNTEVYGPFLEFLLQQLRAVSLNSIENRTAFDEVFQGKGYQAQCISARHPACLCVPLEVKKVFMEEESGRLYPDILHSLREQLDHALGECAAWFYRHHCQ